MAKVQLVNQHPWSSLHYPCSFTATVADGDYSSLSKTLVFPPGSGDGAMVCSSIAILQDNATELDEDFFISLGLVAIEESLSLGNNVTNVTLIDSDGMFYAQHTNISLAPGREGLTWAIEKDRHHQLTGVGMVQGSLHNNLGLA
jgi:hypothetical protein